MLRNYFKIAIRTLAKNKSYAAINIIGLTVSLTAAILLLLWVWDEFSFDKQHSKGDRIFRVATAFDEKQSGVSPGTSAAIAVFGKNELPGIEEACRISNWGGNIEIKYLDKTFPVHPTYADNSFFSIFDFDLIEGETSRPLHDDQSIVISKSLANKYFGSDNPVGKTLQMSDGRLLSVNAVMADMPQNSSLRFDLILPFNILVKNYNTELGWEGGLNGDWGNIAYETFFLLRDPNSFAKIQAELTALHHNHVKQDWAKKVGLVLQPLKNIHLYGFEREAKGLQQVHIFILIAFIILIIACINYLNLVVARASHRIKEISMRKVIGASKKQLFFQFISESIVVFTIASLFSFLLLWISFPFYNELSGKEMIFTLADARIWMLLMGSLMAVVAIAGIYPATVLASFRPAAALKGVISLPGKGHGLRKALVVLQFTSAVVLIVVTLVISKQLEYIRNKDLGYQKEHILTLQQHRFGDHYEAVKQTLLAHPSIRGVSASASAIHASWNLTSLIEWEGKPANMEDFMITRISADRDLIKVLDMQLLDGMGFRGTPADSGYYLLNETAIASMGIENPIGKPISLNTKPGTIAGIVKDFHFTDLKNAIGPCIIYIDRPQNLNQMYVQIHGQEASAAVAAVETLWKRYNPSYDFNYQFLDQSFDQQYKSDIRTGKLFSLFAGIAILLSCLGLFGLVTYSVEAKFKEIGIRKTLGASVTNIIMLMSKDLLRLVGIALVVAFPIAWWIMNQWLQNYAYRADLEWRVFLLAGCLALGIAVLTVFGKSLKAAQSNPIKAIRTE